MKAELQKELKEKVREGVKPSQLRKSRSLSDIPKAPLPKTLARSKSAEELEPNSKIEQLETKVSVLELKLEVNQREIDRLAVESRDFQQQLKEEKTEKALFSEQLKEKQKAIEELRKKLEQKAYPTQVLDQSLIKRHQNLKDWFAQYQKSKQLDAELSENIEQASTELIEQDQAISSLRKENNQLKSQNQSLQKDLNLAQRMVELRRSNSLTSEDAWMPFPSFSWITLVLTILTLWIWTQKNDWL